ncbi:DUF2087 domain-containing protein [Levilactobacillus cerevisiae]|uniref:DUF2087 domain-containing protein n=1 Tax=Levilactobacillus cerevisiae TaxID=1704076 RepID=UPI000F767E1C|nr:DUF2087 domain-containing protein [Levilactobacillus cerevisiae]
MNLQNLSLIEIEQGWHLKANAYVCNYCQTSFATDQVFPDGDQFYPALQMVQRHVAQVHPDAVHLLINDASKYNTLTAKQRELLAAFSTGQKDADIAEATGVAAATVRHQKFTFREKAKQAKLYLAVYDQVFNQPAVPDTLISLPDQAGPEDARFAITTSEYHQLVAKYFTTTDPLRLARWPKHQKAILAILKRLTAEIPLGEHFTEVGLNQILKPIYPDFPLLRRYLVDYDFVQRTNDGTDYWRNPSYKE